MSGHEPLAAVVRDGSAAPGGAAFTPLPRTIKAGFAVGQIAGQLFRDVPSLLLLFYLTSVMGLAPAIAGSAIFVPKVVFGALFDLSVGLASDRLAARFPRRGWLLIGAVLAPLAMLAPFAVPEGSTALQVGWVFVTFSGYMAVYATFSVPYLAQFADMSSDPRERTELMGWKHSFTGIGVLLSSAAAPMLVARLGGGREGHLVTMGAIGIVCLVCLLVAWRFAGRIAGPATTAPPITLRDLPRTMADRRFAVLCLSAVLMTVGAGISYASLPFFVKFAMHRTDPLHDMGLLAAIMAAAVIGGSPLWVMVAARLGKKRTYVLAAVGHALVTLLWGALAEAPFAVACMLAACTALFNAGWGTIVLSLLADAIAAARDDLGENRAGAYSAIWSVIEKAGIALGGTLVVGALLSAFGFDAAAARAGVAQSAGAITGILVAYSLVPGLTKLVAAAIIWRWVHEVPPAAAPAAGEVAMSDPAAPLGLALIGCGRISGAHLAAVTALPDSVRLVAVVDPDPARAAAAAAPFGAAVHSGLTAALADPRVEAVLIATPNGQHAWQALAALRAGKHVLVEKPAAETADEAVLLAREADERGLVLLAGHTFRHSEAVRQLVARRSGFGRLLSLEVSWCVHWAGPQAPWWAERSPEDGLILSLFAPHALDFVQLVMGDDDPLRVHCEGARLQTGWQGEDEAMILLAYPGRRMASVHVSYNQPRVTERKTLFFDRGIAEILDGEVLTWNGERLVEAPPGALIEPQRMGGRTFGHCFRDQLADFAAAVRGATPLSATGAEVARLITLVDRVKASARTNSAAAIDPAP